MQRNAHNFWVVQDNRHLCCWPSSIKIAVMLKKTRIFQSFLPSHLILSSGKEVTYVIHSIHQFAYRFTTRTKKKKKQTINLIDWLSSFIHLFICLLSNSIKFMTHKSVTVQTIYAIPISRLTDRPGQLLRFSGSPFFKPASFVGWCILPTSNFGPNKFMNL